MIVRMSAVEGFLRSLKPAFYEHKPHLSYERTKTASSSISLF
ncbi:MAG: hypothetical protein WB502_07600 [Thermoactinomyces sp.]